MNNGKSDAGAHTQENGGYLLEALDVVKSYPVPRGRLTVLNGASVGVHKGEMLAVMGASGSGKSTLLHALGALDRIDSGSVLLDGKNMAKLGETSRAAIRNARIGFIFQFYNLLSDFTALDNVLMPARIGRRVKGGKGREIRAKAKELLAKVGLSERATHRPFELSGGEQQRVAIARALLNVPDVVLADEPTGNLDPETGKSIHELLSALTHEYGQTMVVVTHNPGLVAMCDRVTYLVNGRIQDHPPR